MKKLLFTLCAAGLLSLPSVFGQTIRVDSVLLHETFETNSATRQYWSVLTPTTSSCSFKWGFSSSSGSGALGSDVYAGYPGASASSGCYSIIYSPKISAPPVGSQDSIDITFYMYRASVSTQDYLAIAVIDSAGNILSSPAQIYVDETKTPAANDGWQELSYKIPLSDVTTNTGGSNFFIEFLGASDGGANVLLDEVTVHHIYSEQQSVSINSPAQGDTLTAGSTTSIQWTEQGLTKVDISYSANGGSTYTNLSTQNASLGSYSWSVPAAEVSSAYLKVADNVNSGTRSAVGPMVIAWPEKLITFNGGDSVVGGSNAIIEWRSRSSVSKMTLEYSVDGGVDWTNIASSVPSPSNTNNSYNWIVPKTETKTAKLRLTDDNGMVLQSASFFSITHNSGISNASDAFGFQCYPNPAHGTLVINFSDKLNQAAEMSIYDTRGVLVAQNLVASGISHTSVDLHDINPGIYYVEVKNNQFVAKQKLIIN